MKFNANGEIFVIISEKNFSCKEGDIKARGKKKAKVYLFLPAPVPLADNATTRFFRQYHQLLTRVSLKI